MLHKRVVIVGGGISGLACAQTLKAMVPSTFKMEILLLEASARLGGQIDTQHHAVNGERNCVIIEAGAEGFVTRSTVFPRVADFAGLTESDMVQQARIADCELQKEISAWRIHPLEPGLAAEKLGFQVPAEDRGRGIRSFKNGMSQLVDAIRPHIHKIELESVARRIDMDIDSVSVHYDQNGSSRTMNADAVILATPLESMRKLLGNNFPNLHVPPLSHNSHVSIHLLTRKTSSSIRPSSFTVPEEIQSHFHGLRAVSFVNEKFADRCSPDSWLFRCYYRPISPPFADEAIIWAERAKQMLSDVFGIKEFSWYHYAPWQSALPVISKEHLELCTLLKQKTIAESNNRIFLIGSEVSGAGLEAAAKSGHDAAVDIISSWNI